MFFGVIYLVQGFHQVPLTPESRNLVTIILPQGKFRFTCLPLGLSVSTDYSNLMTDLQIRGSPGYYKNVENILTMAKDINQLEKNLLSICRARNMKVSPMKFQHGPNQTARG